MIINKINQAKANVKRLVAGIGVYALVVLGLLIYIAVRVSSI